MEEERNKRTGIKGFSTSILIAARNNTENPSFLPSFLPTNFHHGFRGSLSLFSLVVERGVAGYLLSIFDSAKNLNVREEIEHEMSRGTTRFRVSTDIIHRTLLRIERTRNGCVKANPIKFSKEIFCVEKYDQTSYFRFVP